MPAIVIPDKSAKFSAYVRAKRSAHNAAILGTQCPAIEPAQWPTNERSFLYVFVSAVFAALDAAFYAANTKAVDAHVAAIQCSKRAT